MVAMSESATRVIAVEERTLKFDLRTNGGCDRASIRENVANHPSKRPVREASRKTLSTGRRGQGSRLVRLESAPSILPGSTTWKRARRCVMDDDVLARRLQGLAVHSPHGSCRGHAPHWQPGARALARTDRTQQLSRGEAGDGLGEAWLAERRRLPSELAGHDAETARIPDCARNAALSGISRCPGEATLLQEATVRIGHTQTRAGCLAERRVAKRGASRLQSTAVRS